MKLITGAKYDTTTLTLTGWTDGDGSGSDGYHVGDYFRDGRYYLGPDVHGIEPEFAAPDGSQRNPGQSDTTEYRQMDGDEIAAHRANGTMDAPAAD